MALYSCCAHSCSLTHPQREWRQALVRRHAAATAIQAAWRGHLVRKHNGWMCRLLERCLRAYEALRDDRCVGWQQHLCWWGTAFFSCVV